jgi:hypothetical protein
MSRPNALFRIPDTWDSRLDAASDAVRPPLGNKWRTSHSWTRCVVLVNFGILWCIRPDGGEARFHIFLLIATSMSHVAQTDHGCGSRFGADESPGSVLIGYDVFIYEDFSVQSNFEAYPNN